MKQFFVLVKAYFKHLSERPWHSCILQMCHKLVPECSERVTCHLADEIEISSKEPLGTRTRKLENQMR